MIHLCLILFVALKSHKVEWYSYRSTLLVTQSPYYQYFSKARPASCVRNLFKLLKSLLLRHFLTDLLKIW